MLSSFRHQHQGYSILSILLIIAAIVVTASVWAMSGQNNATNSGYNADILATTIITDGNMIKSQYDNYLLKGINGDNIVFIPNVNSTTTNPNILDPINGLPLPLVSSRSIRNNANKPEGMWIYTNGLQNTSQNTTNIADAPAVVIAGVNDQVCQHINKILFGTTEILVNGTSNSADFVIGATVNNPNTPYIDISIDNSGKPQFYFWTRGCINANGIPDNNLYFQILQRHS